MEDLKNLNTEELIKVKLTTKDYYNAIINELATRRETIIKIFGLGDLNPDKHKYLNTIIESVNSAKNVSKSVSHYRIDIPFNGVSVTIDDKEYTIMYMNDSDYGCDLHSYCEGNAPEINRGFSNIHNVEYQILNNIYEFTTDKLEEYFKTTKFDKIEVLTCIYCSQQM